MSLHSVDFTRSAQTSPSAPHSDTSLRVRVLVITADPPMYRRGLASVLAADPSFAYLGDVLDGADALQQVLLHRPDVALLDATMAPQLQTTGRTLLSELSHLLGARIVLLTDEGTDARDQAGLVALVAAVLPKAASAPA